MDTHSLVMDGRWNFFATYGLTVNHSTHHIGGHGGKFINRGGFGALADALINQLLVKLLPTSKWAHAQAAIVGCDYVHEDDINQLL